MVKPGEFSELCIKKMIKMIMQF